MRLRLNNNALTLLELLIAVILTAIIAVSTFSMDLVGRYHIITVDRRRRVQNQVSDALEHMSKNIINTIGNWRTGEPAVDINGTSIAVYVDRALDGTVGDGKRGTGGDLWIAYRHRNGTAPAGQQYRVEYCANYSNASSACNTAWTVIAKNISEFYPTKTGNDTFVTVNITGCWDPSQPDPTNKSCGSADNPAVSMRTRFNLPSVSNN
jgi:hypothetical protein